MIGNVVPPYPDAIGGVSATVEYAVGVLRVPEVIFCGHTDTVGVAGMSERVEQLGGRLEVTSSDHGTTVAVWLPLAKDTA